MWTKSFWKEAADRAVKSAAQGALTVLTLDGVGLLQDVDMQVMLGAAGFMFLYSALTSIATGHVGPPNTPSLIK